MSLTGLVVRIAGVVLVIIGIAIAVSLVHASFAVLGTWLTLLAVLVFISAGAYLIAGKIFTV